MKILVTGKNGLVGSALQKIATSEHEFVFVGSKECDLTKSHEVETMFRLIEPDWVIHAAAKVGGIGGNINGPANYFYDNILMNSHIIHYASLYGVEKLLAFSSVCVFPDGLPVLKEELMHYGEPYHTQFAYGAAKRAIDIQIKAYKQQYKIENYASIIPCNIFGENDYYNLISGHVLPSLIRKIYLAKHHGHTFSVWGDGSAKREFIYSEDLAKIILKILELDSIPQRIIVSNNNEISIKDVVEKLCSAADFKGEIIWETDKPNGQKCRPCDLTLLKSLIGEPQYTDMDTALKLSYDWFQKHYPNVRI